MKPPPVPPNEEARIAALRSYDIIDSEPEPQFDALVQLAAHIAGTPMALVTLIDTDRQWFKARYGVSGFDTPRELSFCAHAVAAGAALIVPDAHHDERFFDNPYVTGDPHVRFYAGMPLRTPEGHVLGTLCALDRAPRELVPEQLRMLDLLAQQAVNLLEARRRNIALATFRKTLDRTHDAILIFDATTLTCVYANEGAVRMIGHDRDRLIGMTPYDFVPDAEWPNVRAAIDAGALEGTAPPAFETVLRDRGDHLVPVDVVMQYLSPEVSVGGRWISVVRDVSERKRVEQLQSEFVSTVSHELRTPLTSIRGSLGLVAAGVTGALPSEAQEYVDIALTNSERLVRLINDILDVEKMQSGKMEFRIVATSLASLLANTLAVNETVAQTMGTRLVLHGEVPDVEVAVDPDRFTQVITNLVSNAAKYAPAGSSIDISVKRLEEAIEVHVRDHGPGVPPEFRARIFQRFAQAESATTRAKGGTGLGLAICKTIVERLGGSIRLSEPVGPGACFVVTLPALPPVMRSSTRPRVLVVEDDPGIYRQIARVVSELGVTVDIAPTLERARRLLDAHLYVAVTLDLVLADGDGSDLLPTLTARSVPVLVVTGANHELGRAAVFVTDVLEKPFGHERLLAAIERLVPRSSPPPRILHVEDDDDLRRVVRRTLPSAWDITSSSTLTHARRLLAEQAFDAVVIDLGLPDGNGADLIPAVGTAHVIVFSASDISSDLARRVASALVKTRSTPDDLRTVLVSLIRQETRHE